MAKRAGSTASISNETPTHDEIAAHAYEIYLRDGCVEGRDLEHWLTAEAELRAATTTGIDRSEEESISETESDTEVIEKPNAQMTPAARSTNPRRTSTRREASLTR